MSGMIDEKAIIRFITKATIGKNKDKAGFDNLKIYGDDFKIKKSEILSVFTANKEKQTVEKIFELFNIDKAKNGDEEVLTGKEIEEMFSDMLCFADMDDDEFNISEKDAEEFLKDRSVYTGTDDVNVFFKFIKHIGKEKDFSKNIKSGKFVIGDNTAVCEVEPEKSDKTGRTYTITDYEGGWKYSAVFGGKAASLQVMTSELYALGFNNPNITTKKIVDTNGTEGVINSGLSANNLDKSIKLGMDSFLGNTQKSAFLNFSGAFDITADNEKKSFTFVPDEFDEILGGSTVEYSHEDLVRAFSTVVNLKDEDVAGILKKYDYDKQYSAVLIKRKEFFSQMLDIIKKEPLPDGVSVKEYLNNVKVKVMENEIIQTTDKRDIIAYQKSIDKISSTDTKIKLQKLLNDKNKILTVRDNNITPCKSVTTEEAAARLEDFGYVKKTRMEENIFTKEKYRETYYVKKFTKEEKAYFKERYGDNAEGVKEQLQEFSEQELKSWVVPCINQRAKIGVDFLADKKTFFDLTAMSYIMDEPHKKRVYNSGVYLVFIDSNNNPPNEDEMNAISMYKGDNYWQLNNSLTKQHTEGVDMAPRIKSITAALTNYLNKFSTAKDIVTYRGEGYEIFKSIKLSNGQSLGEVMEKIADDISEQGAITTEIRDRVNAIISEVQDNNYTAIQERYLSTSADCSVAEKFGKVSLILNLPAGSKAVCPDSVSADCNYPGEAEILCQRGSQLQISDISFDETKKRWTVTAAVVTN